MTKAGISSRLTSIVDRLRGAVRGPGPADLFLRLCAAFSQRLVRWPLPQAAPSAGPRFGVLITPWLSTAVPLLSLECAAMLSRAGRSVVLVLDFTDVVGNSANAAHETALRELCRKFILMAEIVDVSDLGAERHERDRAVATRLAGMNAVRLTWGESTADEFFFEQPHAVAKLTEHFGRVRSLLTQGRFDSLLVPGGIYGVSGVYAAVAQECGLHFSTFDGGSRTLRLTQNGVAAQLADISLAQQQLEAEGSPAELAQARGVAAEELELRLTRQDPRQFQTAAATGSASLPVDVLVPLNVIWDSAALGRQHAFATCMEWLDSILVWAAGRPEVAVWVRQHPRERIHPWKTKDDPAGRVAAAAQPGNGVRFIASGDPVNTYDLLQSARVVLPHTSTVGVEAVMLGKPVVLSSRCYYEELGFAQRVVSREDYFVRIDEALQGKHLPTDAQRERAALNYYLTQRCAWVSTCFSGVAEDFHQWVQIAPDELWQSPALADFQKSLLERVPLALVRHQRLRAAQAVEK